MFALFWGGVLILTMLMGAIIQICRVVGCYPEGTTGFDYRSLH